MTLSLRSFSFVVTILAAVTCARAQAVAPDEFATGRVFVLAFPDTVGNERDELFPDTRISDAAVVMIYSAVANTVTITGGNGLAKYTRSLDAGVVTTIDLMRPEFRDPFGPLSPAPNVQAKNALRITTEHPVTLHCYLVTTWGMEAWSPLPVEAWGTEYFAAAYPGDVVRNVFYVNGSVRTRAQAAPSEIVLIAAYDDTHIAVYPNGRVLSPPSIITLDANEAFQLRSFVDTLTRVDAPQSDLGGSYIVATRPIGVLSGNTRTAIIDERSGLTKNSMKGMAIEWLTPSDMHGRQFATLPTSDDLRVTGTKNELVSQKRPCEVVRVYGTVRDSTVGYLSSPVEAPRPVHVSRSQVQQIRLDGLQSARSLVTDAPVQAMLTPAAVIRSATGGQDTWAAYMTELVPREQWTSFAAYYAPPFPVGMRHYINIVTDTVAMNDILIDGNLFRFNRGAIAGTDLIWGTMEVPIAYQHRIEGRNGARFSATVYGLLGGSEKVINKTYREYLGLSYGYAIGASRRALGLRDTLELDTTSDCRGVSVRVRSRSGTAATVRRIWLDSSVNLRLTPAAALTGPLVTPATLRLEPVDAQSDAAGTVFVEDRAGGVFEMTVRRAAEVVALEPAAGVVFGEAMSGDTLVRQVTLRNRSTVPVSIHAVRMAGSRGHFTVDDSLVGETLAPGEVATIDVSAHPSGGVGVLGDSLVVTLDCTELRIAVRVAVVEPCIELADVDFGTVAPGTLATGSLTVCNRGRGRLELLALAGDSAVVWDDPAFTVNPVFQDLLRATTLGPSECVTIEVFFTSNRSGRYRTAAHVAPSAGACRDSSVWTATVSPTTGIGSSSSVLSVTFDAQPQILSVELQLSRPGNVAVAVFDALGRTVARPFAGPIPSGSRRVVWDASSAGAGVYYCSITLDGRASIHRFVIGQ